MTTANPHSPANIVPADYSYAFAYAYQTVVDGWIVPSFNLDLVTKLREEGKLYSPRRTCHSCGTRFVEGAAFLHHPSGQYILVGHVCADKMELAYDVSEMASLRGKRNEARKIVIEKARRRSELRQLVGQMRETEGGREVLRALRHDHYITKDVRRRLIQWRNLSGRQQALVVKIKHEAESRAKEPELVLIPVPLTEDRLPLKGKILGTKVEEGFDGYDSFRMLVQIGPDDGCYKLWGTIPSILLSQVHNTIANLRGQEISFTCRVERSRKDETFGFIKRPTKAKLINPVVTCRSCKSTISFDDPEFHNVWHPAHQQCDACVDAGNQFLQDSDFAVRTNDPQF